MRPVEHTQQLSILNKGKGQPQQVPGRRASWTELQLSQAEGVEMPESQSSNRANAPVGSAHSEVTAPASPPQGDDTGLLTLEQQFDELIRELLATQPRGAELVTCLHQQSHRHDAELAGIDADTRMKQAESILARLYPIEQAIMRTRAPTIAGLGVKARHAAYMISHYWEEPIDQIDWDAQAIRLLIEAVCDLARTPLPFRSETSDG
jgi:hypothetical protein